MKKHGLLWGAAFLLVCNFISRALGFIYRIMMVRIIGTEGIGLTEMVMPIYSFCLVIASLGIPLAMSRLISSELGRRHYENLQKIWHTSFCILVVLGLCTTVFVFLLSPWIISHFVIDDRILLCFQVLTPAIFIVTICSCYRGYFQATKQIGIIGQSQNIEQVVRVLLGLTLATYLLPYGLTTTIIAVSIATVAGELAGLVYIIHMHRKFSRGNAGTKPTSTLSRGKITHYLFQIGMPVTMQKLLMSLIMMLQAMLIPFMLQHSGLNVAGATEAYGNFAGVAMSLINLPGIFTSTLAVAILPAVAESLGSHSILEDRVNQALHITTIIGFPVMALFYLYAPELCNWLFHAPHAAEPLQILALGAVFIYTHTILNSILQGLGNVRALLLNLLVAGLCLFAGLYLLVPLPGLGIKGAAIAFITFSAINCLLNLYYLMRSNRLKIQFKTIVLKPVFATMCGVLAIKIAAMFIAATPLQTAFQRPYLRVAIEFLLFCLVYLVVLFLQKGLPKLLLKYLPR